MFRGTRWFGIEKNEQSDIHTIVNAIRNKINKMA